MLSQFELTSEKGRQGKGLLTWSISTQLIRCYAQCVFLTRMKLSARYHCMRNGWTLTTQWNGVKCNEVIFTSLEVRQRAASNWLFNGCPCESYTIGSYRNPIRLAATVIFILASRHFCDCLVLSSYLSVRSSCCQFWCNSGLETLLAMCYVLYL